MADLNEKSHIITALRNQAIEEAKADKTTYFKAMMANHTGTCLCIERKYGLEGYPPEVVTAGLNAACQGENAADAAAHYCDPDWRILESNLINLPE